MARLDRFIDALVKHAGEALILEGGKQPCLLINGERKPIMSTPLTAEQVGALVGEIVPASDRGEPAAGHPMRFSYVAAGTRVAVDVDSPALTVVRLQDGPDPAAPRSMEDLLRDMVRRGASDLHLSSGTPPMIRVDGDLTPLGVHGAMNAEGVERLLLSIAPERNRDEFTRDGDTDFAYEISGLCRFRCNIFRDRKGPGGVFRTIPSKILTADDLGLSKEIRDLCFLTKGLVLVTGPTGSGKSTTLTALIDLINSRRTDHVITIEDPIEFVHENRRCLVNQREVHLHTQSFKRALRAALREDPDIVLVGEMRDLETIAIALETAETGHLVLGTLHTSSAVSTVDRMIDQFPPEQQSQVRVMLSESLKAVIAQVLCKKVGGGRVAALEVLMVVPAVANLIREGKTFQLPSIMQTGRKHGMITMNDVLLDLVKKGVIEPKEAYMKAGDKLNLLSAFSTHKVKMDFLDAVPGQPVPTPTAPAAARS